jgi:DNA-binding transcriptional regulator YdaS (Cro superfamily)
MSYPTGMFEPQPDQMREALKGAIQQIGGPSKVGELFAPPIHRSAVSQWRICPADRAITLSRGTGYKTTPHKLRPDLYPHPHDGLPDELRKDEAAAA